MNYTDLLLPNWNKLDSTNKKEILLILASNLNKELKFQQLSTFSLNNLTVETGIFDLAGDEFVFVPGCNDVILGWDSSIDYVAPSLINAIKETIEREALGCKPMDFFKKEYFSPRRTVNITPMFVERKSKEVPCKVKLDINNLDNKNYECISIEKKEGVLKAYGSSPISYYQFITFSSTSNFSLPTEDEYEYLCSAGSRTLFKFGNEFTEDIKVKHFNGYKEDTLEDPNMFGLYIATDPYKYEVIDAETYILKGGDGGGGVCGGLGLELGYLPTSPYHRELWQSTHYKDELPLAFAFARRIIRINTI